MAINTTTVETNLTTKLNATSGTTDAKEFLLLGKAVEALQPSVTVSSVQSEGTTQVSNVNTAGTTQVAAVNTAGTTQVAAVQAAGSSYAQLSGATFTGDVDFGSNKITYSNNYAQLSDLPSASTYHGMFAHVHATGKGYYAHAGAWVPLVNAASNGDVTIDGSLTVNGTQTTINSTTLDVDDLNITVAKGAADAAAANGAGLTVDGASATFNYANTGDKWTMNKALDVTGAVTATGVDVNGTLSIEEVKEKFVDDGGVTSGTINADLATASIFKTGTMGANRTLNIRGDASTTLNSIMAIGETMTCAIITNQGSTAYYINAVTIDGASVTPRYAGGPPTGGNASGSDVYTVSLVKTSDASWLTLISLTGYSS
jgi:hypothetical protein